MNGILDKLYLYPVTQRNYIISKNPDEGDVARVDFIQATSQDRVNVDYQVAVYFKLNTSKLRKFHEVIGLKYHAWKDDGWLEMLHETFRPQIEFAIQRESRRYEVADLYANQQVLEKLQSEIGKTLKDNIAKVLGDDYFCGPSYDWRVPEAGCPDFTFILRRPDPSDEVVRAFEANRTSQILIQTKLNEIRQRQNEAKAIEAINKALERAGQNYVLLKAIESGKVDFWVIPSNTGLNLQTPARNGDK